MKILLIQQDTGRREISPIFPIGLCYIATALNEHQVKAFDPNTYEFPFAFERLKREVRDFKPDIVGISIRDIDTNQKRDPFVNFKTVKPTIKIVKESNLKIRIMVGGPGFSIFSKEIMERLPDIDFGIYLEGEESVPELLMNLDKPEGVKGIFYRKNGQVYFTGPRLFPDFNNLPMPKRDIEGIDITKYMGPMLNRMNVQSKRGCMFSCAYCSYPFLNGPNLRLRDPKRVVDEIEYLANNFNVKRFSFVDSIFNVPESHAIDICKEIIKRNIDVAWEAWCDLRNFSEEFLILAKESGCKHIGFSPDAANDLGLSTLKKGLSERDIKHSLNIVRRVKGVHVGYNLFCSYPRQDFKGLIKTLLLLFKIPLLLPGRGGVILSWIRIEPHTDIYRRAIEEKIIDKDTDLLPEDENALLKLFYTPSSQWYVGLIMNSILWLMDRGVKSLFKFFFRVITKIRGEKSLYD